MNERCTFMGHGIPLSLSIGRASFIRYVSQSYRIEEQCSDQPLTDSSVPVRKQEL